MDAWGERVKRSAHDQRGRHTEKPPQSSSSPSLTLQQAGGRGAEGGPRATPTAACQTTLCSVPAVVLDHVCQLDDELALLVLLTGLKRMLIFPAQGGLAVFTIDIRHGVQAGEQDSLLRRAAAHIHYSIEEVRPALASLKGL